ncbi:hypothetical protein IEN85_07340 [Pelagicoccus sp. NFK12]|uniref:Uncharacterized protein n=1 Tax=Pelagicoccus enzymogenes TaxID=2773457 RepID=A0A927F6G5_9BACT|nr:hypothetical protein [Pelagicoccus enzymogenes]MBD5779303.1 hypothetical protein [Pelagicoccus enzymogenes]
MIVDLPKPGGFASLTSSSPKLDSVPLGRVLRGLADRLSIEAPESIDQTLELFLDEHERYANATRIASLSAAHALKAWAAERLPSIGLSYGFTNRIEQETIKSNLDETAPLKLVEFADDLTLIAGYCRRLEELKIEAAPHSHGLCFRFYFRGRCSDESRVRIEEESVAKLLNEGNRDNSLKKRVFTTQTQVEAECIVLRKKVRLGFSPTH